MKHVMVFYILLFLLLSSCSHYYYSPNTQNVPLFEKKAEVRGGFMFGANKEKEIQTAISITNHLGLLYNYYHIKNEREIHDLFGGDYLYTESDEGRLHEAGVGYYKKLNRHIIFETYLGFGKGFVKNKYEYGRSEFDIKRWFIQPAIGFRNNYLEAALSCRGARLEFDNIRITGFFDSDEGDTKNMLYAKDHPVSFLIEPALTIKAGYKFVKFQFQIGHSFNTTSPDLKQINSFFRVGLLFSLKKEYFKG